MFLHLIPSLRNRVIPWFFFFLILAMKEGLYSGGGNDIVH